MYFIDQARSDRVASLARWPSGRNANIPSNASLLNRSSCRLIATLFPHWLLQPLPIALESTRLASHHPSTRVCLLSRHIFVIALRASRPERRRREGGGEESTKAQVYCSCVFCKSTEHRTVEPMSEAQSVSASTARWRRKWWTGQVQIAIR